MSKPKKHQPILSVQKPQAVAMPQNDPQQHLLQQETIKWILSIICATVVYWVVASITLHVYHPNVDTLISEANKIFLETASVRPEPMESLLFRLGIITIIPGFLAFYILLSKSKFVAKLAKDRFYLIISVFVVVALAALVYFDFAALNPFGKDNGDKPQNVRDLIGHTNFSFYFDGIFTGDYLWIYLLIVLPVFASLFFLGLKKYKWEQNKVFRIVSGIIGYAVVAWALIAIVLINIYDFPYTNENKYDFNAVYQSMTQVYAGVPMLVKGFTNTYGLYPHFLNPLFQLIGLNVFKVSLVMSLLLGLCFVLNFYFLSQFVKNKLILFLGFAMLMFFPYLDFRLLTIFDSIFSLFPIRYIIPSSLSVLATVYFRKRSPIVYYATFVLMALFILWNPELGIICYPTWLIANIYNDFYDSDGRINIKEIAKHIVVALAVVVAIFYLYKFLIYAFYGAWPDLSLLFSTILYFGKFGLGNLPMAIIHPWNLWALILVLGFGYALVKWYKKEITVKSSIILLVSLIGLGYLFYFQGRSQNSNFSLSSSFCIVLLTLLGDELWAIAKERNVLLLNGLFVVFLGLVSFSFIEIIYNSSKLVDQITQEDNKDKQLSDQKRFEHDEEFMLANSKPREKIIIFAPKKRQALYFGGSKRILGYNPGFIDMFLASDLQGFERTVRDSSYNVFIEPNPGIYDFLARPLAAFACSYTFVRYNSTIGLFTKRKILMPGKAFFTDTDKLVIHRKYTDDTLGRATRVNDAQGIQPVQLSPEFSVECLFYSAFQAFDRATLVANSVDSFGFAIGNYLNSPKYFFQVNGNGSFVKLPYNEWSYVVLNVFPDHFNVYRNGALVLTHAMSKPVVQSAKKMFIGNIDGVHYYIGGIAEVAVANKVVDTVRMRQTWQEINSQVQRK